MSFRIRKLSLNFLSPDEERPLVNASNDASSPYSQQLPSIVIEQPEMPLLNNDSRQRKCSGSTTSNPIDTTKL